MDKTHIPHPDSQGTTSARRRGGWKTWILAVFSLVAGVLFAEAPHVGGRFRVPEINADGVMTSLFTGESARMIPGRPVEITGMRIFFFEPDGETVRMEIRSPISFYDERSGNATSDEEVIIEGPQFTVTGKKFNYNASAQRLEIFQDARVVLRDLTLSTLTPAPGRATGGETPETEDTETP